MKEGVKLLKILDDGTRTFSGQASELESTFSHLNRWPLRSLISFLIVSKNASCCGVRVIITLRYAPPARPFDLFLERTFY
jgi:hypothetical protein